MGFINELFGKSVQLKDLKVALIGIERDRRKHQVELRKLSARQSSFIEQIKQKRKTGNDIEVDYVWEDLKVLKTELGMIRREAKRSNLEGIALKRYIYAMDRLKKKKDEKSIQRLIERVRNSSLDSKLRETDINDQEYLDELSAILEEIGLADEMMLVEGNDPEKEKFLAIIDDINDAEDAGNLEDAIKKEDELKSRLENLEASDDSETDIENMSE